MEPAQLLDIVQKMKKLEQKDIDDYLLSIQAAFYAAAKKSPQKCVVLCESQDL
jgi:ribosomal protein L12E/L44/L45/RPP1/RPP2